MSLYRARSRRRRKPDERVGLGEKLTSSRKKERRQAQKQANRAASRQARWSDEMTPEERRIAYLKKFHADRELVKRHPELKPAWDLKMKRSAEKTAWIEKRKRERGE